MNCTGTKRGLEMNPNGSEFYWHRTWTERKFTVSSHGWTRTVLVQFGSVKHWCGYAMYSKIEKGVQTVPGVEEELAGS